jgi:glutathione peroxidase
MPSIYDFTPKLLNGREQSLRDFEGKAMLIVNTASACGFTPQYQGLEQLQKTLSPRGFTVLGFPCNQFGGQEPGDADAIASFCSVNYGVSFPIFAKVDVNGSDAHPLFVYLKTQKSGLLGSGIKWNFTKFLIDRSGHVVDRFGPTTSPSSLTLKIEALL